MVEPSDKIPGWINQTAKSLVPYSSYHIYTDNGQADNGPALPDRIKARDRKRTGEAKSILKIWKHHK